MGGDSGRYQMGRTTTGPVLKQAAVFLCLFVGVLLEQHLWDETIMESPNELTVTEFEIAEETRANILSAAIEDQETVCKVMAGRAARHRNLAEKIRLETGGVSGALADIARQADIEHWQACRVLALLKKQREAGRLA